jgi:hypothetical protein
VISIGEQYRKPEFPRHVGAGWGLKAGGGPIWWGTAYGFPAYRSKSVVAVNVKDQPKQNVWRVWLDVGVFDGLIARSNYNAAFKAVCAIRLLGEPISAK